MESRLASGTREKLLKMLGNRNRNAVREWLVKCVLLRKWVGRKDVVQICYGRLFVLGEVIERQLKGSIKLKAIRAIVASR